MGNWLKTYAAHHLFYILLIVGGVVSFRVWLSEHDARVHAESTVRDKQALVASLQQQIEAVKAQTADDVRKVRTVVRKASTPAQVVAAIPDLTQIPLQARVSPVDSSSVEVAAQPLMQLVGELKTTQIELGGCQQTVDLKDKQLAAKDEQLKAALKKPRFLHRLGNVAKAVGVGIAVGLLISTRL